jgi:hypothetical protein
MENGERYILKIFGYDDFRFLQIIPDAALLME